MYDFCVIVPVKNAEDTVAAQIDALVDQSWPGSGEVVVVDNGSNDNTAVIAQSRGSSSKLVRVLDASRSIGAGAARNFGAAHSQSRLLLFCDADDVVARFLTEHALDSDLHSSITAEIFKVQKQLVRRMQVS